MWLSVKIGGRWLSQMAANNFEREISKKID
jgi:hypothetical protein